jgi:hypothetical protein
MALRFLWMWQTGAKTGSVVTAAKPVRSGFFAAGVTMRPSALPNNALARCIETACELKGCQCPKVAPMGG